MYRVTFLYILLVFTSLSNHAHILAAGYDAGLDVFTNGEREFGADYQSPLHETHSKTLLNLLKDLYGSNKDLFRTATAVWLDRKASSDDINDLNSTKTKRGLSTFAKLDPTMYFNHKPTDSEFLKSFVRGKFGYSFGRPRPLRWG